MALNVLVVDDSMVGRSMVIKALELSGVEVGQVHQAANGREGLEILDGNWVDLIFADINMPVMNGEQMIEQVRANEAFKDTAIVVISTEGSMTRIDHLTALGAKFIHKPFTPEQVRDVVREITGVCQ